MTENCLKTDENGKFSDSFRTVFGNSFGKISDSADESVELLRDEVAKDMLGKQDLKQVQNELDEDEGGHEVLEEVRKLARKLKEGGRK